MVWKYLLFSVWGFLSGSLMFSAWVPRWFCGVDVIAHSDDHNPGTANVFKLVGAKEGILCLLLDLAKGYVPVFVSCLFLDPYNPLFALALAAPVLGHAFSPFLKGKGGKAIATSFGALLGLWEVSPAVLLLAIVLIFFSTVFRINPHSLRVIISFHVFLVACLLLHYELSLLLGIFAMVLTVTHRHLRQVSADGVGFQVFGWQWCYKKK